MDKQQIEQFKEMLTAKSNELQDLVRRDKEQLGLQLNAAEAGEPHIDFNHPADMVGGDPDYEKELSLLQREREELAAVGDALNRIAESSYGICERCGKEIPLGRLKAIPYTRYCIDCQEMLDRNA